MQRSEALQADDAVELVDDLAERLGRAYVVSGREQMAGVEADPDAVAAAGGVEQRLELLERAAEGAAGAGGVLEVERALVGLGQRFVDDLAGALDRLGDVAGLRGAGVQHHADSADPVADSQRLGQRRERLLAHLAIGRGAVDQVDRVDEDGLDSARAHRLAELREVILGVGGGPPHARRLAEDLDRVAVALDPALDRAVEAAGVRDVCAD